MYFKFIYSKAYSIMKSEIFSFVKNKVKHYT